MSHWTVQASRFGGVGLLATAVHVTAGYLLNLAPGASPYLANLFGFACAFGVSYLSNFYWTFAGSTGHGTALKRFFIASALCFLLSNAIVFIVNSLLHQPFEISLLAIAILIPPLSFMLAKFWAFRSNTLDGLHELSAPSRATPRNVLPR